MSSSTLAQFEARVSARLVDASNLTFSLATIDEALRTALADYTEALPQADEGILILPGTGREIALDSFADLIQVLDVWWPYDSTTEVWPPNMVSGFRVWWDDTRPVLLLSSKTGNQPQVNDTLRLWYAKPQTIANLDSASITSVFPKHETGLVIGASAYAVQSEMRHQIGSIHVDPQQVAMLDAWSTLRLAEFKLWLVSITAASPSFGAPYGEGWGIDKWDSNRNPRSTANFYPTN